MNILRSLATALLLAASLSASFGQNEPVIIQAESGVLGSAFTSTTQSGVGYIAINSTVAGQNPTTAERVATYTVTFPAAGIYDLYARVRVNAGGFNDDSFYYGNGFGTKAPTSDNDWILANGLAAAGYNAATDVVAGAGTAPNNVWKWIKLSEFNGGETPIRFNVPANALTQTFQIAGREDGLDIDRFAFGRENVFYTVANLDNGQAGSTNPPPPPYTPSGPPLATGKSKFLGNVYASTQLPNFTNYWNQVTPENAGKWGSVEGTRDVMNWTELDAAYNFAKSNGYPFRFHVLVWGSQQPAWIESLPTAEQREEIEEWFAAVAARYPAIDILEVVNEPLHAPPSGAGRGNYIEALGGSGATGWDWIINAFRLARKYFPQTRLMMNEYSVTGQTSEALRYRAIIELLQAENLINVIGIQGHAFETRASAATNAENLNRIAATGLPIVITEMDIDGPNDTVQLQDYQRLFPVFWEHPSVEGITLWGYRPGMWRTAQGAYLAHSNGAERPALLWLKDYVGASKRAQVRVFIGGDTLDRVLSIGATEQILSRAADPDGDLQEHWIEIQHPSGQWSWEGWLRGEPWEGGLGGNGGSSLKYGSFTFSQAGTYWIRASAVDSTGQWQATPAIRVQVGLSARPVVTATADGSTSDRVVSPGTTLTLVGQATDADGDLTEHWLELQNPAGQWSWEGWLVGEPWGGGLNGGGASSVKSATFTFTQPGTYRFRSSSTDTTGQWVESPAIRIIVQ